MKDFFSKLLNLHPQDKVENQAPEAKPEDDTTEDATTDEMPPRDEIDRRIDALFSLLVDYYGSDKLVIKAGKMDALQYIRSPKRGERVLALQRIIHDNPTIKDIPADEEISPGVRHPESESLSADG